MFGSSWFTLVPFAISLLNFDSKWTNVEKQPKKGKLGPHRNECHGYII